MEEAFLPTLRTLFNAPPSSPLAEVNVNNVADLMVQLTNARHLVNQVVSQIDVSRLWSLLFEMYCSFFYMLQKKQMLRENCLRKSTSEPGRKSRPFG